MTRTEQREQELTRIAEAIYSAVYDGDDKYHRAATIGEIYDWLANGSPDYALSTPVDQLAEEWADLDN